jgi:1-acyl-sn-glycerol-3-phosphate acyltransferase
MVFPEGRRSMEGRMNHFKSGIGILAAQLNVPVVPVKLCGLYELKKSGRRGFAEPNRIRVTFGEAVKYALVEEPARIARDLEKRVAAL